jgi:hypothetical protein
MVLFPAATGPSMAIIDGIITLMRNYIPDRGVRQLFSPSSSYKHESNYKES